MALDLSPTDDDPKISKLQRRTIRKFVLSLIEQKKDPSTKDLTQALLDLPGEPVPQAIVGYWIEKFGPRATLRKPGPKPSQDRETFQAVARLHYRMVLAECTARERSQRAADGARTRTKTTAKRRAAKTLGVSVKTLERYMARGSDDKSRQDKLNAFFSSSLPPSK